MIVLGAIGTAGFLNSSGIISSFPNSFSWIANVGTIGHGVMLGGAGLGIVAIAVGGTKCHQARMAEKAQTAGRRGEGAGGTLEADDDDDDMEASLELTPKAVSADSQFHYANIVKQGQYVISYFTGDTTHSNINVLNEKEDGFVYYSVLKADVQRAVAQLKLTEQVAFINAPAGEA